MLPSTQILTAPTSLADCKQKDISSTARSLISSSFLFLQVDSDLAKDQRMADRGRKTRRGSSGHEELWFSLPSSDSREHEWTRPITPEQSAYQVTSNRHSTHGRHPPVPAIRTTTAANKPLPPSPEPEKKKRGTPSIRSLIRRRPSGQLDSTHLQPEPAQHQRSSSANGNLLPDPTPYQYPPQFSRSMPSSPATYSQNIPLPAEFARAHSAMAESTNSGGLQIYQSYQPPRAVSMNTYFESGPPRSRRTFPDSGTPSSATPRDAVSDRPRPHTWLSPTEPFEDASDFHLFAEATAGLPPGALDMDLMSPNDRPQLQGSLFSRGRQNDVIPLPMQYPTTSRTTSHTTSHTPLRTLSQSHQTEAWQTHAHEYMAPPPSQFANSQLVSSSALPRPDSFHQSQLSMNMNGVNLELERLGIEDDEVGPDDELPNYAQSQAEMSAKRRAEATTRARELEARWNNSRGGWRGR